MKKLILFVMTMSVVVNCYAIDLNYTMTNANADRIVAMLKSFEDSIWATVKTVNPTWNDYQIAKEVIRRILIRNLRRYEASIAGKDAQEGISEDNAAIQ